MNPASGTITMQCSRLPLRAHVATGTKPFRNDNISDAKTCCLLIVVSFVFNTVYEHITTPPRTAPHTLPHTQRDPIHGKMRITNGPPVSRPHTHISLSPSLSFICYPWSSEGKRRIAAAVVAFTAPRGDTDCAPPWWPPPCPPLPVRIRGAFGDPSEGDPML